MTEIELVTKITSEMPVVLTGSRYFEANHGLVVNELADWDMACGNDPVVIRKLKNLGFHDMRQFSYGDYNSVGVMKHSTLNIECCVKFDLRLHENIFNHMSLSFYKNYVWKSSSILVGDRVGIVSTINRLVEYWSNA